MTNSSAMLIGRIHDLTHRWLTDELSSAGLSGVVPAHGDILALLMERGEASMHELADFARDKRVKEIWFCCDGTINEKLKKSRTLLDLTENAAEQLGDPSVYLGAFHITAAIRGMLNRFDGSDEQKSAIDKRRNELAQKCDNAAAENEVIREYIKNRYNTDKLS